MAFSKGDYMALLAVEIDFDGIVDDMLTDLADFIPKLIAFIVILVVGLFVARWIRKIIGSILEKIKFDALMDKSGLGGPLERAGYRDSGRFIALIIYYLMVLLVLKLALSAFGENDISNALDGLIDFIPKLVIAIAIVIVTGLVANAVGNLLRPSMANVNYGDLLARLAVAAVWIIGVFAAIDQIEFAQDIVDTMFTALIGSISAILILQFGIGGIWSARDRFWPAVYDGLSGQKSKPAADAAPSEDAPPQA